MLAACGGGGGATVDATPPGPDAEQAPVFRNPLPGTPDSEIAINALQILGANVSGADDRCGGCHPLTRSQLRYWATLSDTAMADCFTDLGLATVESAQQTIDCFRLKPGNISSAFQTPKLGPFSSATRLPWFQFLFRKAYGGSMTEYDAFVSRVGMPPGAEASLQLTQAQFDVVAEWFIRGAPLLDDVLPEDPPPTECFPSVASSVADHVADQAINGWRAHNADSSLNMYGCGGATDPLLCLQGAPPASTKPYGTGWDRPGFGTNRVLYENVNGYASDFWTRGSADGRFIAHGGGAAGFNSTVLDLQDGSLINIAAAYDPAFFPDNSGFVFQGGGNNLCPQSVLANAGTNVSMNEVGCSDLGSVGLYEHVGGVIGGDYFSVDGEFVSDNGGHVVTLRDPQAWFGGNGQVGITPMIFNGTSFQAKPTVNVDIPYEGDTVISPSAKLLVSRLSGPSDRMLGFVMREVIATPNGSSYDITAPEVARYCVSGGKPALSYDERWLVYHHYISATSDADAQELGFTDADDPGFTSAPTSATSYASRGVANVFLLEIATGEVHRITHMKPGQYALFPHFRSDGWIYYQVRDIGAPGGGDETEYSVASDAALQVE
jgi:hypothetical protein